MQSKLSFSAILRLLRPKQWIKNTFVLAPLVFSGTFTHFPSIQQAIIAFILFCLASSATYVLNDIRDIESDKKHPEKSKKRPLASGEVSKPQAYVLLGILYSMLAASVFFFPIIMMVVTAYVVLNIFYSLYLKHQPVLDIFTIAMGFVLRVLAGSQALDVPLSAWMFITTFSLALFLAAIKRRQELARGGENARDVLQHYTESLVDRYAEMSGTSALLFYSLYIISDKPDMMFTIPFVLFGLYRYWFVVESTGSGESPTDVLFADRQLQLTIIFWIAACVFGMMK